MDTNRRFLGDLNGMLWMSCWFGVETLSKKKEKWIGDMKVVVW